VGTHDGNERVRRCLRGHRPGPLAQLVEQRTLNPLAEGSSPSWPTGMSVPEAPPRCHETLGSLRGRATRGCCRRSRPHSDSRRAVCSHRSKEILVVLASRSASSFARRSSRAPTAGWPASGSWRGRAIPHASRAHPGRGAYATRRGCIGPRARINGCASRGFSHVAGSVLVHATPRSGAPIIRSVHSSPSSQSRGAPGEQTPDTRVSNTVHAPPSSHAVPSATGTWVHKPVEWRASAVQGFPSPQSMPPIGTQEPLKHESSVL
jgi:hypothetical protein